MLTRRVVVSMSSNASSQDFIPLRCGYLNDLYFVGGGEHPEWKRQAKGRGGVLCGLHPGSLDNCAWFCTCIVTQCQNGRELMHSPLSRASQPTHNRERRPILTLCHMVARTPPSNTGSRAGREEVTTLDLPPSSCYTLAETVRQLFLILLALFLTLFQSRRLEDAFGVFVLDLLPGRGSSYNIPVSCMIVAVTSVGLFPKYN